MELTNVNEKSREELLELLHECVKMINIDQRYHLILDSMAEGFQFLDRDLRYLYVNNAVINQSKFSGDELLGYTINEKYPGIENTNMFLVLRECLEKQVSRNIENEFVYADGSKAWFRLSIQPVNEGLFVLSMDITDAKKAECEKKQYIQGLAELLFKISHQVRQPVCHIMGVSHLFNNNLITVEDLSRFVDAIKDSVQLLDVYTKELTDFVSEMQINAESNKPHNLYPKRRARSGS